MEGCFNPRLPGGRRPTSGCGFWIWTPFQSTPSGGKATRSLTISYFAGSVSIHAFRGEGDRFRDVNDARRFRVSIHAFRGEGDTSAATSSGSADCFNPRLPGGRRRATQTPAASPVAFQSTPSGGKATSSDINDIDFIARFQSTPSGGKATPRRYVLDVEC